MLLFLGSSTVSTVNPASSRMFCVLLSVSLARSATIASSSRRLKDFPELLLAAPVLALLLGISTSASASMSLDLSRAILQATWADNAECAWTVDAS